MFNLFSIIIGTTYMKRQLENQPQGVAGRVDVVHQTDDHKDGDHKGEEHRHQQLFWVLDGTCVVLFVRCCVAMVAHGVLGWFGAGKSRQDYNGAPARNPPTIQRLHMRL